MVKPLHKEATTHGLFGVPLAQLQLDGQPYVRPEGPVTLVERRLKLARPCPQCGGEGVLEEARPYFDRGLGNWLPGYREVPCEHCCGRGEVEREPGEVQGDCPHAVWLTVAELDPYEVAAQPLPF